jgi:single-strand DNA-binding protein
MASFNKVILMGRLTADPELKQTPSGAAVTTFTLAVDRRFSNGENKQCDFITIVAWRQTAEFICKHFGKGQAMLVCGELQTRSWKDKDGNNRYATEVKADEVNFCETKKEAEGNSPSQNKHGSQGKFTPPTYIPDAYKQPSFEDLKPDEDLPF